MLKFHVIDVDMCGSGLLLQTPTHNILIDLAFESGTNKLINYLTSIGIDTLHLVVITHPHRDHMAGEGQGGLSKFFNNFNIIEVWSNGLPLPLWYDGVTVCPDGPNSVADYDAYLNQIFPQGYTVGGVNDYPTIQGIGTPNCIYREPRAGDIFTYGELTLKIFNPPKKHIHYVANRASIVIQAIYRGKKIMLCGDSNQTSEGEILNVTSPSELKSDILYLGHHGIYDSTTAGWYNAVNPDYVTVQRRDKKLSSRIKNLIRSNGAILTDIYGDEDFYNPNPENFNTCVYEIDENSITPSFITPLGVKKRGSFKIKTSDGLENVQAIMKDDGVWKICNNIVSIN